jgi:ethanolaminephosphotransferase
MVFISQQGLKRLLDYKYVPAPITPFSVLMTKIFWDPISKFVPSFMAPNALTIISSISVVFTTALLCVFSDLSLVTKPALCLLGLAAAGYFWYDTLDILDGKQARRLKVSSPLGQLLDHGLDGSVNTLSVSLINIIMISATDPAHALFILVGIQSIFFYAAWNEHHCGVLQFQILGLGVHEFAYFNFIQLIWTTYKGYGFWDEIAFNGLNWREVYLIYIAFL